MIAAELAVLPRGGDRRSDDFKTPDGVLPPTQSDVSTLMQVPGRTLTRAKAILRDGTLNGPAMTATDLAPLVAEMTARNIATTASCVDIRGLVNALEPGASAFLAFGDLPPVNFRRTVRDSLAYVRYSLTTPEARVFHAEMKAVEGVEVQSDGDLAQVSLPRP